ncbi:MAG: hypothetical protein B7Y41_06005 [Hydrogenophilales bacterium 28-61-23]|nr:MAG: hypothetical protein B7Y41_06005 [Hydrogenophilales bacterium 28-61-23]
MSLNSNAPSQADRLPFASHPGVLARLLAELGGADSVSKEASRLFMLDPALALLALEAIANAYPGIQLADLQIEQQIASLDPVTLKCLIISTAAEQLAAPVASLEELETTWRQSLATAHFTRALAEQSAYRGLDEAWLAGLLCWLPRFARHTGGDIDVARACAQSNLDRLGLDTFLPDILRYANEPAHRLRDAAPLLRLALAAYRQTMNYPAWIPALPHPDTLLLAAPIDRDNIRDIYLNMGRSIDTLAAEIGHKPSGEIARELSRMGRLELIAGGRQNDPVAGVNTLADSLASQEGLGHALYLRLNPLGGALEGLAIGGRPQPPIVIQPEGSTTAAAWALLTRSPVVVTLDTAGDASVLDLQLIRQANAEGIAAIPIGATPPIGVLLVRGSRHALSHIAANPQHYTRLGELAGRNIPAAVPAETGNSTTSRDQFTARVRRAAHEINNPLGIIKNYLVIMKAKLGDDAPVADELRIMHEELDRSVRIIRGLTQDETAASSIKEVTDINALIEDLVKVTSPSWQEKGAWIEVKLEPGLPKLACDRDKLKQIVLNLLLNALEASPLGGMVKLETGSLINHRQERMVEIIVSDSGPGIPVELVNHLFSPVESEKGDGHAGLGLSIVKSLTEALEGRITFKTGASGTTFQISLPAN